MSDRGLIFALLASLLLSAPSARGAVVILKDAEPLRGFVVERGGRVIVSDSPTPTSSSASVAKADVVEIVPTVSTKRLDSLTPERPEEHLAYAEELFQLRADPEARWTAARLCLIAGKIDSARLASPALRMLLALVRDPRERSRVAAFGLANGWLAAAAVDRALENATGPSPGEPEETPAGDLLKTLRLLRQGKSTAARRAFNDAAVAQLQRHADIVSAEDFREALSAERLAPNILARLLALELALEQGGASRADREAGSFSGQLTASKNAPWRPLAWETLLDGVDPAASIHRDGQWRRP